MVSMLKTPTKAVGDLDLAMNHAATELHGLKGCRRVAFTPSNKRFVRRSLLEFVGGRACTEL